jgi:hypothetical protein
LNVEQEEKELAARWVAKELPLANGAGVFLDAGSSCREMGKQIIEQVKERRCANLSITTNNLLVIRDWIEGLISIPELQGTTLESAGEICDVPHLAYYGDELKKRLTSPDVCLSAAYIGASAIDFHEVGGIRLSYHAGEWERHCKELLFRCSFSSKGARVILASPAKIGNSGGRVLDVLSITDMDTSVPIYLVTAEPGSDDKDAQERFRSAKEIFRGQKMQSRLRETDRGRGFKFYWVIVGREDPHNPKVKEWLVYPDVTSPLSENQLSAPPRRREETIEHSKGPGSNPASAV